MSGSQTSQQLAREALEEHRPIHFYLDQVANTLETLGLDPDDVEPMRRLAAQIEGLTERLKEHHELEENRGLFRAILESIPEARVEVFRHGRMLWKPMSLALRPCAARFDGLLQGEQGFVDGVVGHLQEEGLLRLGLASHEGTRAPRDPEGVLRMGRPDHAVDGARRAGPDVVPVLRRTSRSDMLLP